MIDIYATYTKNSNGTINTNRILLQTVPASNESGIIIQNPTVKGDMGNAESMDFSIQPGTPYYGALLQMRTYIQVDYDGETIFYGRVLTISEGYFGEQKIHCEGALAFLNDSYFPGKRKESRSSISIYEHMTEVIDNHNSQVNEPLKTIQLGEVPGHYTSVTSIEQRIDNTSREFGQNGWSSSKSVLEDLKSHYGGVFRIRYTNNTCYLDWMNHYYRSTVSTQEIKVGKNLIDLSRATEVSNIFTAIIPIGKSSTGDEPVYITGYRTNIHSGNYLTVPQICKSLNANSIYTDAQLESGYHTADDYKNAINDYGLIFKTVEFQEAHDASTLLTKAAEWIKNNYQGGVASFTVKALDLHFIGVDTGKIMLGDRVKLTYPVALPSNGSSFETDLISIIRTCTSVNYDLFNPENNQYTFGIPANMLSKTYGENSAKKGKGSSSYKGKDTEYDPEHVDDGTDWLRSVYGWLEGHKVWFNSNGGQAGGPRANQKLNHFFLPTENMEDGETIWELWGPFISQIQAGGTIIWQRDSQGRPRGDWNAKKRSEFTYNDLTRYHLFEYVQSEYGIDLRTGLSVKMPTIIQEEDGSLSIFAGLLGEGEDPITKILSYFSEDKTLNIFSKDGKIVGRFLGENGDYLFAEMEEYIDGEGNVQHRVKLDENGNPILVSTRDLKINQYNTDRKVGWFITEGANGELGFNSENVQLVGEMSLSIEDYYQGKLVVARQAGDLVYLGTQDVETDGSGQQTVVTQNLTAASLNHMDMVCGDVSYETDPVTGIKYLKVDSGGGMRIHRGVIDENGEFQRDDQGRIVMADFGLYDDNNLTGGILVTKINDATTTTINGTNIVLGGTNTVNVEITAQQLASFGLVDVNTGKLTAGIISQLVNSNTDPNNRINLSRIKGEVSEYTAMGLLTNGTLDGGVLVTKINGAATTTINGQSIVIGDSNTLTASVTAQQLARFGLVDANTGTLTGGMIIEKINDGSVVNKISGDRVYISGDTTIAGALSVTGNSLTVNKNIYTGLNGGYVQTNTIRLVGGGSSQGAQVAELNYSNVHSMITSASVDEATNTLTLYPLNGTPITFSKATTTTNLVSGSWSGSNLIVAADPNGKSVYSVTIGKRFVYDQDGYAVEAYRQVSGDQTPTTISGTKTYLKLGLDSAKTQIQVQGSDGSKIYNTPVLSYSASIGALDQDRRLVYVKLGDEFTISEYIYDYRDGKTAGYNSAHVTGSWNGTTFTYSKTPNGSTNSSTTSISNVVGMQQDGKCYAYVTYTTPSSITPTPISETNKVLAITNSDNNAVKLTVDGSDSGLTFDHGKYTSGYNSARVTGSWSNNKFTYSKTNNSSYPISDSITIGTFVGMQSGECYVYATKTSSSQTSATSIGNTSKKLTIVDSGNNAVKLQAAGVDTGLTYTHDKYRSGWFDAAGNNIYPSDTSSTAVSVDMQWPSALTVGNKVNRTYTLACNSSKTGSDALNTVYLKRSDSDKWITVARIVHGKYDLGWTAAYNTRVLPKAGTSELFEAKWPGETPSAALLERTYQLTCKNTKDGADSDNIVYLKRADANNWTTIARITHGKYTAGYKAGWKKAHDSVGGFPEGNISVVGSGAPLTVPSGTVDATAVNYPLSAKYQQGYQVPQTTSTINVVNFKIGSYTAYRYDANNIFKTLHHVTLDDAWNNDGSGHWNCRIYDSNNMMVRSLAVNSEKTSGLMFPTIDKTVSITSNGAHTYTAKTDDSVAAYRKITVNVSVPSASHNILCTTNASWYIGGTASEDDAMSAAAQAMGVNKTKLTHIDNGKFKGNSWIWFKVTCGTEAKYYYTKVS